MLPSNAMLSTVGLKLPQSYTLQLPEQFNGVHPVYHISMLEPHVPSSIPGRVASLPPPVEINGDIEYEISEIVDSKLDKRRKCPLLYRICWTGYEDTNEEYTWVLATELEHAPEAVADFHLQYPDKPGPLSSL